MMLSIQLLGLTLTIKMIIVSQLIEELDSLGIIVLHDKPSKYVDKWSWSSLSSADKRVNGIWICLAVFYHQLVMEFAPTYLIWISCATNLH
jgi:hypothetical protein